MITSKAPQRGRPEGTAVRPPGRPGICGLSDQPLRYDAALRALAGCVCQGSIHHMVLRGLCRDEFLARPQALAGAAAHVAAWWRPAAAS